MAESGGIKAHAAGAPFNRVGYTEPELTQFVHECHAKTSANYSKRCITRQTDLKVNIVEVDRAVAEGVVESHEVGPSRSEIRLEIRGTQGDMTKFKAVVYLSSSHDLFVEDIRDSGAR